MAGAQQRAAMRHRRGFVEGGGVDGGGGEAVAEGGEANFPVPPIPPPGGATGAMSQPGAMDQLSSAAPSGAIGRNVDPERAAKMASMQRAATVLQGAGIVPPQPAGALLQRAIPSQGNNYLTPEMQNMMARGTGSAPDSSNLALLAAAGAMLQPTHGGTFGESLGNAVTAGASVAIEQRKQMENAALRIQQQMMNNDYHQMMGASAMSRAQSYGQNADTKSELANSQEILNQARIGNMTQIAALRALNAQTSADSGTWIATRGFGPDGTEVPGLAFAPKTGGAPVFTPMRTEKSVQTDNMAANQADQVAIKNRNAATNETNAGTKAAAQASQQEMNDARIKYLSTLAATKTAAQALQAAGMDQREARAQALAAHLKELEEAARFNTATRQDLDILKSSKDPYSSKFGLTPEQAGAQGRALRAANAPPGGSQPNAPPTADAPASKGSLPPVDSFFR